MEPPGPGSGDAHIAKTKSDSAIGLEALYIRAPEIERLQRADPGRRSIRSKDGLHLRHHLSKCGILYRPVALRKQSVQSVVVVARALGEDLSRRVDRLDHESGIRGTDDGS